MATVYLAEDVRHRRRVALKLLHPDLGAVIGPERFLAEIATTATLQHPNILPLFDSGTVPAGHPDPERSKGEGPSFVYYVMPYVEGESLRARLARERVLPVDDAIRLTAAVAAGLDHAHRHGVIHRDIKPENILLQDGQALVADFGIALAVSNAGGARLTQTGLSLGTPQYMSPEQATAERAVDARTDVYSLGAVCYEMLAGEPPFTAPTAQGVIARLLTEEPRPLASLRRSVPPHVAAAVHRALQKLPADRWSSAGELAAALTGATPSPTTHEPRATPGAWRPTGAARASLVVAALAAAVAAGVAIGRIGGRPESPPVVRFTMRLPDGTHLPDVPGTSFDVSPDGTHLVYAGSDAQGTRLFVKRIDTLGAIAIPGTTDATSPFFSPDGDSVAFVSGGALRRVSLRGGPVETIAEDPQSDRGHWASDGSIVYSTAGGLRRVMPGGEGAQELTTTSTRGSLTHEWPVLTPSGDAVLFTILDWSRGLETSEVAALRLGTTEVRTLIPRAFSPRILPTGHLLFARADGTLEAVRFDATRLQVIGRPVPVVEKVRVEPGGEVDIAISRTGILHYLPGATMNRRLMKVDRAGNATPLLDRVLFYEYPTLSPAGDRVAARVFEPSGLNLWLFDLARGTGSRITSQGTVDEPSWTRDGRFIAVGITSRERSTADVYRISTDGSGARELLSRGVLASARWTSRDSRLVLVQWNDRGGPEIMALTPGAPTAVRPVASRRVRGFLPAPSPDGRWLAFVARQGGRSEVLLRRLGADERQWTVSTDGGSDPLWAPDGSELFYRRGRHVLGVSFRESAGAAVLGIPRVLFEGGFVALETSRMWDIDPTGKWFVMVEGHDVFDELITVQNWFGELERRVRR